MTPRPPGRTPTMGWGGFVPVLQLLAWLHVALAEVEPPSNLTFHCHNLHNVLRWSYNQSIPGIRFKLFIGTIQPTKGYPAERLFDPPALEADLSFLSDPMNAYFLELRAVNANEESAPAPGEFTFSYFKDSFAHYICSLDLPSVNVTALPNESIKFNFTHPWMLYNKNLSGRSSPKHRKRSSNNYDSETEELLPEFSYVVTMDQHHHDFICDNHVCEETLPVNASQPKHCLAIVGELEKMTVKGTQVFCAEPYPEPSIGKILTATLICTVLLVVGFVVVMMYKKRTSPSKSDVSNLTSSVSHPSILSVKREEISVPKVEPTSPTPLLYEEVDEVTHTVTPDTTDDRVEDEGVFEEPGYKFVNLDEDESENSNQTPGYERRPDIRQPKA